MIAAVTGGGGFLGRRIVELLLARGDEVRVLARQSYPSVESLGARSIPVDIRDTDRMQSAIRGTDVVFHVAGKTGHWGPREEFWSVNAEGTRSVLEAVRRAGVPRIVHTSSPSVVGYARDIENGGLDLPYAASQGSPYAESKAAGEQLVLAANLGSLATVALRPHLIIGPGDRELLPRVLRKAARGSLRVVGNGTNRVDLTFIDNAAWAHLDACDALTSPEAPCAGRGYFISNDEPVVLWNWLNALLNDLGLPRVTRTISFRAARWAGFTSELVWKLFQLRGEPPVTRFLATALARSHWYDMEPARRDVGYRIRVSMKEASRRTLEWLRGEMTDKPAVFGRVQA
jgi:nucleoside-diphosphate-sugar epimerase